MSQAQELPYRRCVGITLVNSEGNIWAGQRVDNPSEAWQMPQGGIDKGEEAEEAAYRELWEETGIGRELVEKVAKIDEWLYYDLPLDLLGKIWKGRYRGQRQKWFLYRYLGRDDQVVITCKNQEFRTWKWATSDEIIASVVPFKRDVYRQVFNAFAAYLPSK